MIQSTTFARVGIAGNPSDMFHGKVLSACIRNFSAKVTLEPADRIIIEPNCLMDALSFTSPAALIAHADNYGYYGALRLINATCALFHKETTPQGAGGYTIRYESDIPRQVGLGGSSAIVVALLKGLHRFYDIEYDPPELANMAWRVENEELSISCGYQDRVVQTYGGIVFMDFAKSIMKKTGHGCYVTVTPERCPRAFIAYTLHPRKTSGAIHNPIRYAYEKGDSRVMLAMEGFAAHCTIAYEGFIANNIKQLLWAMDSNWKSRLGLYGKEALGETNLKLREIAERLGFKVKLTGSGGCVIGLYETDEDYVFLSQAYVKQGYCIEKVEWDRGGMG